MNELRVELGNRSYPIIIGDALIADAAKYLAPLAPKRIIIVTDETVAPLQLASFEKSLEGTGIRHQSIMLPAGEQTKSFAELERLLHTILEMNPDRKTMLIALGGGVVGDITGFAASIVLRGLDFIQIPTTLLAQVDSSVGGKTGINTRFGKNLIGSFYQPRLVLADISTLTTLPRRHLLAGYAEVVKYGIINDEHFFTWLEANGAAALNGDKQALTRMIFESCQAKALIVGEDEREAGKRALLNFGHTLGHALEAETGFGDLLLHGEAVAIGMMLALRLSVKRELCSQADYDRVKQHFNKIGLPISPLAIQRKWNAENLIAHCYHDKKAVSGGLTFILAEKIGKTFISHDVTSAELEALLAETL